MQVAGGLDGAVPCMQPTQSHTSARGDQGGVSASYLSMSSMLFMAAIKGRSRTMAWPASRSLAATRMRPFMGSCTTLTSEFVLSMVLFYEICACNEHPRQFRPHIFLLRNFSDGRIRIWIA